MFGAKEVKPYQVDGKFDIDGLVAIRKQGNAKTYPWTAGAGVRFNRQDPTTNTFHINVYADGQVHGVGEMKILDLRWAIVGDDGYEKNHFIVENTVYLLFMVAEKEINSREK